MNRSRYVASLLGGMTLAACSAASDGSPQASSGASPHRVGARAQLEWEGHLRNVERHASPAEPIRTLAMRSGGAITALLQDAPSMAYVIQVNLGAYLPVLGGPNGRTSRGGELPRGVPSDIVGVTRTGLAWYLDPQTGRVVSEDIGGNHQLVATLPPDASARAGCLVAGRAIAFLSDAHPDTIFVRLPDPPSGPPPATRALPVPAGDASRGAVPWSTMRFGGSAAGPCVLWAPRMPGVLLVSDSALRPLGPLIERAPVRSRGASWLRRLRRAPDPALTLDATSGPGVVAVLAGGHTTGTGRMVDLYDVRGGYQETMVLPHRTLRIALNGERVYALRQDRDSLLLASYVLPWRVRALVRSAVERPDTAQDRVSPVRVRAHRVAEAASRGARDP